MIRKEIQYKDLEGNNVVGEFWFHMSVAEMLEMEKEVEGGMKAVVQKIVDTEDETKVLPLLRDLISRSVGKKSSDGRRFLKTREDKSDLVDSDAYSKLMIELLTVPNAAVEFFNGVAPKDIHELAQKVAAQDTSSSSTEGTPVPEAHFNAEAFGRQGASATPVQDERDYTDWRTYTEAELLSMDNDMFEAVAGKVKPGMDRTLMGIAFRRRARQAGA